MADRAGRLTQTGLAWANLRRRPGRTAGLVAVVAVLAFVVFAGAVLEDSIGGGLESISRRLGADLIVVPEGSDGAMEGILLQGSPGFFYFEKYKLEQVAAVSGVEKASAQFYLTSVAADCCDIPVELIGFDPETDFTVQPWVSEVYGGALQDGEVIVGADISPYANGTVRFYNANYPVAAKLEKTGTGLDQAVYGNWNTLIRIFGDARSLGLGNIPDRDPERSISSVLVKTASGADPAAVAREIERAVEGVTVIRTSTVFGSISVSLGQISGFLTVFALLFALTSLFTLGLVFSVTAGERKKEFATLRMLGLTRGRLAALLLREAAFVGAVGGLLGTGLAALVILPFSTGIGAQLGLPYLQPSLTVALRAAALSVLLSVLTGPLAASVTAARISCGETGLVWREGE